MRHKAQAIFDHLALNVSDDQPKMFQNVMLEEVSHDVAAYRVTTGGSFYIVIEIFVAGELVIKSSINNAGGMVMDHPDNDEGAAKQEEILLPYINAMLIKFDLYQQFLNAPIHVREVESIPPGANPFNHDLWRMGTPIDKDLILMYSNSRPDQITHVVLVNTKTGRRFDLDLSETYQVKN